jgi:hypothetical protein
MLEVNLISSDGVRILLDNERRQTPCMIEPKTGEHRLEIFTDAENIRQIKVFDQTLDRKKALRLENSVLFVFDIVNKHANFSKHTGSFGTTMLRKDRIVIDD